MRFRSESGLPAYGRQNRLRLQARSCSSSTESGQVHEYRYRSGLGAGGVAFYDGEEERPQDIEAEIFYNAVTKGTPLTVKPEQALVVTQLLEAIYESAKTGKTIYFD